MPTKTEIDSVPIGLHAWDSKKGGEWWCCKCDVRFKHDPALQVECPRCYAHPGYACQRPSGHSGPWVRLHTERDQLAIDRGAIPMPCSGGGPISVPVPKVTKAKPLQPELFASLVG